METRFLVASGQFAEMFGRALLLGASGCCPKNYVRGHKSAKFTAVGLLVVFYLFMPGMLVAGETDSHRQAAVSRTIELKPSANVQYQLQESLINADPGDTIELSAGIYHFSTELNIACDNITIRGAGPDSTILSFRKQSAGSSGIVTTGNAFVIEDLAVEDTVGNAIKSLGASGVTYRNVRVEWTDGPSSSNGAYGIYPVECSDVLIENCISVGASDAGIYVGQSQDVIVRGCLARQNVAGIEIENSLRADVYDNTAVDNAGGILVFDLPGLNVTNGGFVRVFGNTVKKNNHVNFAPNGTMVADVPSGTGIMLMATDHVEIFDNDITSNQTSNVIVVSFLITERKLNDRNYDPYPEAVAIHNNRMSDSGAKPSGQIGKLLAPVMGGLFPDVFYDGLVDLKKVKDGRLPAHLRLSIHDNGEATFANVNIRDFSPANILTGKYKVSRDVKPYGDQLPPLPAVVLKPHQVPSPSGNPAVAVYRAAPKQLSEWELFVASDGQIVPASDVVSYTLNTPLFSDYAVKHRFIRLPGGGQMLWNDIDAFEFPVGTVVAKTFAYPNAVGDFRSNERFIETRIEHRTAGGWHGYSYIWNDEQTDATLKLGGGVVDVSWLDDAGVAHVNRYQVPNANQCLSCHAQNGRFVPLGPTAKNLNCAGLTASATNQLAQWASDNILTGMPRSEDRPRLAVFDDPHTGSVEERARAWLDVNCAHCHNPVGSARTSGLDLRTVQVDPARFGVFKSPVAVGKGSGGRRYDIVPGKPDESILMYRIESEEPGARMPSLARNLAHGESNELVREWIRAMSSTPDAATD